MVRLIRLGIVSFAHMHAWSYARAIKELEAEGLARLEAIYDEDPSRISRAEDLYRPGKVYRDLDRIVGDPEIDAVIVASENAKHKEHSIPAMKSGKHVLVEKPIATRLEDAREMVEVSRRAGVKLQVAFVMRYHQASVRAREAVKGLGRIISITSTNHGRCPFSWFVDPRLSGGGALMDHVVHVADLVRWYTGEEFKEVMAFVGKNIYPGLAVEDNGLLIARLSSGALVSIDCSWSRPSTWPTWGDVYMHIVGEKGLLILNAFNQNIWVADKGGFRWAYYGPDADKAMIADFIEAVKKDREPRASGIDGLKALEVVIAAYRSLKEGRPIRIPEDLV